MKSPNRIVLASQSPRRRALLEAACFTVEVRPAHADETWPGGDPCAAAVAVARRKLSAIAVADVPVLAADTEVVLEDVPLGKPRDADDAAATLARLAGRSPRVITGFCIRHGARVHTAAVVTEVRFRPLSAAEIHRYVATGEPMDKAGSYAIQGQGGALVDHISGSYTNVVGLPLAEVVAALEALA